ncbi:MotA/TolQ/ExbB proton channel family protein [Ideonella livida]|uniref:MotA/TolQ/ExbB proton channel family protein n=1 Tax=Ideonella livida TaxID=2707176 RepID=A0A7C9TKW3_9BURK|nr:MotA/TolQ/ExbB proton channel family protein [Ideonella livida]NDY90586.1 MotA/TolQ/ExbB proton channel family protein [Ideonella livida]
MFSIIEAAGWPIWPLILCSIAALALVIERAMSLRRPKVVPKGLVQEVLGVHRQGALNDDVLGKLAANSVFGTVLAAGLRTHQADRQADEAVLRQSFELAGRTAAHQLERYLNTLGTIATAAPLLGLLGTVVGMIEIFGAQAPGSGTNPAQLAHGISIALYNTAFGLIVAIPSLVAHRFFRGRVNGFLVDMEQDAETLLQHLLRSAPRGR